MKKAKLGKGLSSLIDGKYNIANIVYESRLQSDELRMIPVSAISPNPNQPRNSFNENDLQDLSDSIRESGLIQPVVVRELGPGRYCLIAGERRLRAFQLLHKTEIPSLVRNKTTDSQMLELALIENIQRENLNPIERAQAYQQMMNGLSITQEQMAQRIGKSRAGIANTLRLLHLPAKVQDWVSRGELNEGHAKVLLQLKGPGRQLQTAQHCVEAGWSVRSLEQHLQGISRTNTTEHGSNAPANKPVDIGAYLQELQERLTIFFGTRVLIKVTNKSNTKGKFIIEFNHNDDFENVLALLFNNEKNVQKPAKLNILYDQE